MAAADVVGRMRVEIVGDNSKLDKSINTSKKNTEKFGKSTASLGKNLGKLFAGIGFALVAKKLFDLGKQAENLFRVQELAETKLDATLKSTAFAAGLTADELKRMASGLQEVTTFGDEATIGAQSLLLTFKDIGGDVFPRALESILDVSTAMGQGLQQSTIQLGKALNDPIGGIAALTRVGIQFTDEQKNLIKSFVESGEVAKAQGVILDELESQFGGLSRAAALTADGINKQLNNSFGDLLETIGRVISEGLTPYRENLKLEVESVNKSIQAHIIRKKALEGNAELIELLTLRQIEQEKAEQRLAQARLNVANAEANLLKKQESSDIRMRSLIAGQEAAIEVAKRLITTREAEVEAAERATTATQQQVIAESNRVHENILLAQGIVITSEETENNTEVVDENTESIFRNLRAIQDYPTQFENAQFAHRSFTEAVLENNEILELSTLETWAVIGSAITNSLSSIDVIADNFASAELQRLEDSGASQDQLDKAKRKFAREDAIRQKASAIASIGFNTPAAIVNALTAGPILGPILAGIIGGLAAFQLVSVIAAPLPAFAQGGIVSGKPSRIDNRIAKVASGELIANQDQKDRMLMEFLNGGGSGGGTTIINAVIDKKVLFKVILDGSRQGTAQFASRGVIN